MAMSAVSRSLCCVKDKPVVKIASNKLDHSGGSASSVGHTLQHLSSLLPQDFFFVSLLVLPSALLSEEGNTVRIIRVHLIL